MLIIDCGDIWESHHYACLLSFGADLICPYLAIDTCSRLKPDNKWVVLNYIKAVNQGILKIMSKLGISTLNGYKGAQTFEALGIAKEVTELCCENVISRIGGLSFEDLDRENKVKHQAAFEKKSGRILDVGNYRWTRKGEYHMFNPTTIHLLQHATRSNDSKIYEKYSEQLSKTV